MEWKLYHKDGTPLRDTNGKEISVHSLKYDGEWMGECSVSVSIENEAPIDFEIGDYLIYRNERFELNYDPGKAKQGRKNALGNSFKYQDVKFNSLSDELARAEFLDVVLNDNELHYTALPVFQFYVESLDDLLDRLQACMNEQVGGNKWLFYSRNWNRSNARGCNAARWEEIYGGDTSNPDNTGVSDTKITSTSISIDKQTVWEGLALVNSQFDVNFITRNREVFVGTSGLPTRNVFKYGKGNGLYEVNQDAEADQQIVTRMRAYGSDKNIPDRYYATLNMEVWSKPSRVIQNEVYGEICNIEFYIDDIPVERASVYFTYRIGGGPGYDTYSVNIHDGGMVVEAKVNVGVEPYYHNHISLQILGGKGYDITIEEAKACFAAIQEAGRVHFVSGVNKEAFPSNRRDYAAGAHLPNNMACFNLMLPGFPSISLQDWWNNHPEKHKELNPTGAKLRFSKRADRPWIESPAADVIGVRPGSVFFDTEDVKEKTVEIYPTIKEMEVDGVRIDEIAVGSNIEDNGVFKEGATVPGFKLTLKKELNFDINALKQSDFSVTMVDGMCAGRKFKVSGSTKESGQWVLTLQRVEDIGLYFPYKDFQINAGDHFVLSGIELPVQYVEAASEKLLRYAIAWLIENDHTKHTYAPKIDEIYMARQHDEAMEDTTGTTKSLHDTIKEGDIFQFSDEDFGISADVIIDSLSITEKEGAIPTYEVSLRNDKEVGALQKIQNKITAISNSTGDFTPAQVKEYIQSEGSKYFLSKVKTDVAEKLIRFWEGIAFGEQSDNNPLGISSDGIATLKEIVSAAFRSGALGSGFKLGDYNGSGDSYLEVDRLLVRKAAEFVRLVIRELQSVGGEIVLSPAAMKISNVVYFEKGVYLPEYEALPLRYNVYRCYFSQKKGDEEIENQFVEGDLVRCQTFNVKEGVSENVKNRYYWRKVYKVGKDFIDVLADDCDTGSDIPQAGDELVQMGNVYDTARQSVVVLSAYGADAPSLKMYYGVNSYSLDNREVFVLSRSEMFAIADKFRFVTRKANGEIKSTQSFAELVMSVDGLKSTVATNKDAVDGQIATISSQITQTAGKITTLTNEQTAMGNKISKIEQSTEKISLQVETTTNLKNCIVGSALRPWDDIVKIAAGLSQAVNIINGGGVGGSNYAVFNAQGATANTWTGLYFKDVRVTPGKKYIFSVWVRVIRATDSGAYYTIKRFDNGVGGAVVESKNYPNIVGDWALYTSQITVPSGCSRLLIETAIRKNGTINLCRLMLMEGTEYGGWSLSPYDKTEAGKLETDLKSTGVDIENGKITATADRFEIRNNSGETTASVNEKGEFETYSGLFSGFVRKRLTTITPNNIDKYLSKKKPIQNGYVTLDFVAAGSYIELSGNFGSKLGSAYPVVTLPFYQPANTAWKALVSDSLIGEAFTPKGAAAYLGQTFIIRNNTSGSPTTTINLVGYTSLVGGKDISKPYWLERGWMAILTCEFVYVPANRTYSIVWNGYNVPFESPTAQSDDGKPVNDGGEQEAMSDDPTTEEEQPKD